MTELSEELLSMQKGGRESVGSNRRKKVSLKKPAFCYNMSFSHYMQSVQTSREGFQADSNVIEGSEVRTVVYHGTL